MNDIAIRVESLSKRYRIGVERHDTLRDALAGFGRKKPQSAIQNPKSEEFWALRDVSFEVKRGEVVGVIGRNGAGKSTLLKILSRITEPTGGIAEIHGRVGSLLEVGTGFHPELTGRENIYLNGAILGMKRTEIDRKFDEIVAFSEIEKFLDTPVKRYSSGMYVRLAFAVAAHLEPEILLVDEVLAVGDVAFQKKCLGKMGEVANKGRTVFFVSHNMAAVRKLCSSAILLDSGITKISGPTDLVIDQYLNHGSADKSATVSLPANTTPSPGQGTFLRFLSQEDKPGTQFNLKEKWKIIFEFEIFDYIPQVIAAIGLVNFDSVSVITYWSKPKDLTPGCYMAQFDCAIPLGSQSLRFNVGLSTNERSFYYAEGVGHVTINQISRGDQPVRSTGLLIGDDRYEILATETRT